VCVCVEHEHRTNESRVDLLFGLQANSSLGLGGRLVETPGRDGMGCNYRCPVETTSEG
jgi:hypothetical protein